MERLTYKTNGKYLNTTAEQAPPYSIDCDIDTAITKLAEYEDLEEQGKLLNLPCKPHDKLYWISDQDEDAEFSYEPIEEIEVCNIDYNGYSLQLWFADKGAKEFPVLEASSIGKELFYTREEAESALKELGEG